MGAYCQQHGPPSRWFSDSLVRFSAGPAALKNSRLANPVGGFEMSTDPFKGEYKELLENLKKDTME